MLFIGAWRDSLKILIPKNFKLFLLVTLKAIIETYYGFFKYFWWLFLGGFVAHYIVAFLNFSDLIVKLLGLSLAAAFIFLLLLFARPSVHLKNCRYALGYWRQLIFFTIFFIIYSLLLEYVWKSDASFSWIYYISVSPVVYFAPFLIFLLLFFFDSNVKDPQVFVRAIKMVWYNYPLCFISYSIFFLFFFVLEKAFALVKLNFVFPIIGFLLLPIPICFFTNVYVKKLHDQFKLYFG